jgi:hypothetical protein
MKRLFVTILGCLCLFVQPAEALGKVYQYIDEQGAPAYTDSLDKVPPSQRDQYRPMVEDITSAGGLWETFKLWIKFQKYKIEGYVMSMSILERLISGICLSLFSLTTLYVLMFKSNIANSFPRILFRLVLILTLITTTTLSYFTLTHSLIQQTDEDQVSPAKGRADIIRQLEKAREKKVKEESGP